MKNFELQDNFGNIIRGINNRLELKVTTETKFRILGTVQGSTLFIKRKRSRHLFRKSESYGFNHYILSNAKILKEIHLTEDEGVYIIPISEILKNGHFLRFKNSSDGNNYELQIFLPLTYIKLFNHKPGGLF